MHVIARHQHNVRRERAGTKEGTENQLNNTPSEQAHAYTHEQKQASDRRARAFAVDRLEEQTPTLIALETADDTTL
jgi:hypothetical protein